MSRSNFPGSIDEFAELFDLPPSRAQDALRYQVLKAKASKTSAEIIELNNLTLTLKEYIISPEDWNKFTDCLVAMEVFIKDEVEGYILTKQGEFNDYIDGKQTDIEYYVDGKEAQIQVEIDKFDYKGVYSGAVQYYAKNIVDYNDGSGVKAYLCILDSLGNVPTNTTYWKILTIKGEKGDAGENAVGLTFKGAWADNVTYDKDDSVQYGGTMFASLIELNLDNEPVLGADTDYWARAFEVAITTSKLTGYRNIASVTSNVNFITGEITSFNPSVDSLAVFMNSVRLTQGVDYTINANNQSIDKVSGTWNGSPGVTIFFEFEVLKNIVNDLVFNDGSSIEDGTIAKSKLVADVQEELNSIGDLDDLETYDQNNLVSAINEVNENTINNQDQIGDLSQLETYDQSDLVSAINEVNEEVETHKLENASQAHTLTINEQAGTTYVLVLLDNGRLVDCNNAGAITLTIPTNASVEFPIGTQILIRQKGAGQVTVTPDVGVTLNTIEGENKTRVQYSIAGLIKITTDTWSLFGDLEA